MRSACISGKNPPDEGNPQPRSFCALAQKSAVHRLNGGEGVPYSVLEMRHAFKI